MIIPEYYINNGACSKPWYYLHEEFIKEITWRQYKIYTDITEQYLPFMSESEFLSITKSKKLLELWIKSKKLLTNDIVKFNRSNFTLITGSK